MPTVTLRWIPDNVEDSSMTGANPTTEEELALYDAIERAIINVHAALAEIDRAWARITGERPRPSASAFAALDRAQEVLTVAQDDLKRARSTLASFTQTRLEQ
jgi:hypothetical protein